MKFRIKHFVSMAVALGLLTSCAGGMDSGDTVKARRDLMRNNNANLKAIGAFVKAGKGSAADVATRAQGGRQRPADQRPISQGHEPEGPAGPNPRQAEHLGEGANTQSE